MKIFMKLNTLEDAQNVANLCEKYADKMFVDVYHGRYTLSGRSLLQLTSMIGSIVRLVPEEIESMDDLYAFKDDVVKIGGSIYE